MPKAFKTFREFLQAEALGDPMAMAIIHYQKKMIEAMFNPLGIKKKFPSNGKQSKHPQMLSEQADRVDRQARHSPVEIDANLADYMGTLEETALNDEDALESQSKKKTKTRDRGPKL